MTCFPRRASNTWGSWDAWNALLPHGPRKANFPIARRPLDPWRAWRSSLPHDSIPFVSFFSFDSGLTSHAWQALPALPSDLSRQSWRTRRPWPPRCPVFSGWSGSPWLGREFYRRDRHSGIVVLHPLVKHFVHLIPDEHPDLVIADDISRRPWQSWVPRVPCGTRWTRLSSLPRRPTWSHGAHFTTFSWASWHPCSAFLSRVPHIPSRAMVPFLSSRTRRTWFSKRPLFACQSI